MNQIKLSILIPTYNFEIGINKILDCIKSTDDNLNDFLEIIISDDSDKEIIQEEKFESFENHFNNFRYIYNENSLGAVENWNKLISMARGDYIWLLHHDEFWQKEKKIINYIIEVINMKKPNVLILPITKSKIFSCFNMNINVTNQHITFRKILRKYIDNPKLLLKLNIVGPPSTVIYKKNNLSYDRNLKYLVDVEFYMRLFKFFNYKNILIGRKSYNLVSSQNNNNSITSLLRKEIKNLKYNERSFIFSKYNLKFKFHENILSAYSYFILKLYLLFTTRINIYR